MWVGDLHVVSLGHVTKLLRCKLTGKKVNSTTNGVNRKHRAVLTELTYEIHLIYVGHVFCVD